MDFKIMPKTMSTDIERIVNFAESRSYFHSSFRDLSATDHRHKLLMMEIN